MFTFALSLLVKTATTTEYIPLELKEETPMVQLLNDSIDALSGYYGFSSIEMKDVIRCESEWNIKALNKDDPNDGSKGLLQFQQGTFDYYSTKLGIIEPDIWNPFQQLEVASFMWGKGLQFHWSCWKKHQLSTVSNT